MTEWLTRMMTIDDLTASIGRPWMWSRKVKVRSQLVRERSTSLRNRITCQIMLYMAVYCIPYIMYAFNCSEPHYYDNQWDWEIHELASKARWPYCWDCHCILCTVGKHLNECDRDGGVAAVIVRWPPSSTMVPCVAYCAMQICYFYSGEVCC